MRTLDQQIADSLREAERSGELRSARGWGRPLELDDAWDRTPEPWRMAFKVMKDAGLLPPEVALMHDVAAQRKRLAAMEAGSEEADAARRRLQELQVQLALRLERLRA
jgi:hypothetical protein